jgi:guanylate kinase
MNELARIDEFKIALSSYKLSSKALSTLKQTKLVLLTAATASGRNTIINELLKTGEYHYIVSDTTRKPRINNGIPERDGQEYWFRSEQDILADIKSGEFLEAEVIHGQQVSGISIRELQTANESNKIAITDIDIGGTRNILRLKPDTMAILVLPPSFDEWQRRIKERGDMHPEEYQRRLQTAVSIFESALDMKDFRIVINDTLTHAVVNIHQQATEHKQNDEQQQMGRDLAERLLVETKLLLKQFSTLD